MKKRIKSFGYAFSGIRHLIVTQMNARIHLCITLLVVAAGFWVKLSREEWCLIILAMMIVWLAEGLNTAIEFLADVVSPDHHPLIGKAKDIAAGAVMICALGSVVLGILVFYPHFS